MRNFQIFLKKNIKVLDCSFNINENLKKRLDELRTEAEVSVREGKKHLIKFFPTINDSIQSYFNNINTHKAYDKFRKKRKLLRDNNLQLDPETLVQKLDVYAEDKNYVKTLKSIIRINKLTKFDNIKIIPTSS